MKVLIYAVIIIAVIGLIFGKVVIPIWMDLEDAKYERDKKKEGKAKAAERADRARSQYETLSEITAAYKNEEYKKVVELLRPLLSDGLAGTKESSASCLYYGADSMRRIASAPDEWETALYWAVACGRYKEDHGSRSEETTDAGPMTKNDALTDLILSEGGRTLQETYRQTRNGTALMEAGSFKKALEVFESAAKAGSRDAAEQVMKLQLLICAVQEDVPALDACLQRCRVMGCIETASLQREADKLKQSIDKPGAELHQRERFRRRSCEKAEKALKQSKPDETVQEAMDVLQELSLDGYAPARVALNQYKAALGDTEALLYLAGMYDSGLDGQKADPAKARKWYEKAADSGSGYACLRLYELTGERTWLQRGETLGAGKIAAGVNAILTQTADETPTASNYTRVQHALALRIRTRLPDPYRTDMEDDVPKAILRDVDRYAELDARFREIPMVKKWLEEEQYNGWDTLAKLKSIYRCCGTEKDGPERREDRNTIVKAVNLYEIHIRIADMFLHDDDEVMCQIARLYLPYNRQEAKAWLDKGISQNRGACLLEAYDRYEDYGYECYDVSNYRERAIRLGYRPAIEAERAEALEWEREKDAMLRERYPDPVAKRRREEQERAERRKELDEKLDLVERLTNSDGLTSEEQYQLGKRDVYDHVRDELFREALHDALD